MTLINESKQLGKFYEPMEVFEACIAQGKEHVKALMYMHSIDEYTHYFKCKTTRKYSVVRLDVKS